MIYVLALLLSTNPYPTFAFLRDFTSMQDCVAALEQFAKEAPKEIKENAGCMALMKPNEKDV